MLASISFVAVAVFVLMQALKNINYQEVLEAIRDTDAKLILLAFTLVVISYATLTLYDVLALRTINRSDVPYRIAALASFTSYPIAHGVGAVALVSPIIRYRVYSCNGLNSVDVANICFLTGLTFWLGNLTALGLSLLAEPHAISLIDYLSPIANRFLAGALLAGVAGFLIWTWLLPRSFGIRWPIKLPSGPKVLVQISIGIVDLGAAALALYVLVPAGMDIGIGRLTAVFIAATLAGFISHSPAGIGVFDAAIMIGLGGGQGDEQLIAALLMFRFLYHLLPFVTALGLLGVVEVWRGLRTTQQPKRVS